MASTSIVPIKRAGASPVQLFLGRLLRRSVLTEEEQAAILGLPVEEATYGPNRDFVAQGQRVDRACLVAEGLAARFAQTANGDRQIIAFHIPGDMADLHSVVAPSAASALQALTRTTILRIPHSALRAVAARYPAVAQAFWRDAIVDVGIIAQSLVNLGRRPAVGRLAHLYCEMAVRYEQIGECADGRYRFPATQAHIGDALGLTSIHVNRTLKTLRTEGLVDIAEKEVRVLDWDGLAARADFDLNYLQLEPIDFHGADAAKSARATRG